MVRDFKGIWIPREVWLDERLTALDKFILMEVDSLDGEEGCYATNEYIAGFCQCSERKVRDALSKLKELGYVYSKGFDGRQRVLGSKLTGQGGKKCHPGRQNLPPENTSRDTGIKDTCNEEARKPAFKAPTLEEVAAYVQEMGYSMIPQSFYDYYASVGWTVGKNKPMKDWKASVRRWEAREQQEAAERRYKGRVEGFTNGSYIQYR